MNNLPKVVTQHCLEQDLNPRPTDHKSNALPLHHRVTSEVVLVALMSDVTDTSMILVLSTANVTHHVHTKFVLMIFSCKFDNVSFKLIVVNSLLTFVYETFYPDLICV